MERLLYSEVDGKTAFHDTTEIGDNSSLRKRLFNQLIRLAERNLPRLRQ
jgi:hypothetical protein